MRNARRSIHRHTLAGLGAAILLVGGIGGWAIAAQLSGAVIAPGAIVVESNLKSVQHPSGGVVGEILARDGDHVRAGAVLIRLDETVARASLALVSNNLDEMLARQARLEAERDGAEALDYPAPLVQRLATPERAALLASERRLFDHRRTAREGQKAQLHERIGQLQEQIEGLELQADATAEETRLIQDELVGVDQLWRRNLVPITRVTTLRREEAQLRGQRGQFISGIAQARGRISETRLQILQVDQDLRSDVSRELRETEARIAELTERAIAAEDQLRRIDIRAPQDGIVHQSSVHTVGGVIRAGDALMMIVLEQDALSVKARVSPQDIDQVQPGQDALLRLSAFNQSTTPELRGEVAIIAAGLVTDPRGGQSYYPVRIAVPDAERERLDTLRLARHARGKLHPHQRPHRALLPGEAADRPSRPRLPRGLRCRHPPLHATVRRRRGPRLRGIRDSHGKVMDTAPRPAMRQEGCTRPCPTG